MDKMNNEAVGFDYPNEVKPQNYNDIYHTKMRVPHPTNNAAKVVNHDEIMRAVNEGK